MVYKRGQLFFCLHCLPFQPRAVFIISKVWNPTLSTMWGPSLGTRPAWVTPPTSFTFTPRGSAPSPGWASLAAPLVGGLGTWVPSFHLSWPPLLWCNPLGGDESELSFVWEMENYNSNVISGDTSMCQLEPQIFNEYERWRILWHQNKTETTQMWNNGEESQVT